MEVAPAKNYLEKCVIQQDTKLNYGSVTTDEISLRRVSHADSAVLLFLIR